VERGAPCSRCPGGLESVRVARQRQDLLHEPVGDAEEEDLVERELAATSSPARSIERGGALVTGEDVEELRAVRPVRLLQQAREEAEDLLAPSVGPGHDASTGDGPDGVLGEEAAEGESLLASEGLEDPADEGVVLSRGHVCRPSGRGGPRRAAAAPPCTTSARAAASLRADRRSRPPR